MLSHTIETEEDWILLLNLIDRKVEWTAEITTIVRETLPSMRKQGYGQYFVFIADQLYLRVTVKSADPDILIHEYPIREIHHRPNQAWWSYFIIASAFAIGVWIYVRSK